MKKMLKTSAESRKCGFQDCTCILSIYNNEAYCHFHRDKMAHQQVPRIFAQTVAEDK